jgi:autotransporter-associated beta strand protein
VDSNGGLVNVLSTTQFVDGTGAGSLTKSGLGTLLFQGTNTYSGDTVIASGTLRVENVAQQVLSGTAGGTGNRVISGLASTTGLFVGQGVSGANIGASARIASISGSSVTLTVNGTSGATTATFAAAEGTLQGTTLNYDNQGGVFSFGQSTALVLGGLKGLQNLALTNAAAAPVILSVGGNNANTVYGGAFSGAGSLIKQGTGVFTLSGSSTFTGATAVNAGKLVVNGALANTSGMTVAGGGALGGSGSINGLTTIGGTLSPGNSPGILTFDSLLLSSSATTLIEIAAAGVRGTDYDGINVLDTNGLTYGGTLTFAFGGSALADNALFSIFNLAGGTAAGSFTTLTSTGFYDGSWSSVGGGQWQSSKGSQTLTFSESTGQLVIVPEPGSLVLTALGCAAVGWTMCRRRRAVIPSHS